jgi:hypothetical protein
MDLYLEVGGSSGKSEDMNPPVFCDGETDGNKSGKPSARKSTGSDVRSRKTIRVMNVNNNKLSRNPEKPARSRTKLSVPTPPHLGSKRAQRGFLGHNSTFLGLKFRFFLIFGPFLKAL